MKRYLKCVVLFVLLIIGLSTFAQIDTTSNYLLKYTLKLPLNKHNKNNFNGDHFPKDFIKPGIKESPSKDYMDAMKKYMDSNYYNELITENMPFSDHMPVIKPYNFKSKMPVLKPDPKIRYHIRIIGKQLPLLKKH